MYHDSNILNLFHFQPLKEKKTCGSSIVLHYRTFRWYIVATRNNTKNKKMLKTLFVLSHDYKHTCMQSRVGWLSYDDLQFCRFLSLAL